MSGLNTLRLGRGCFNTRLSINPYVKNNYHHPYIASLSTQTHTKECISEKGQRMSAWQCNGYDGINGLTLECIRIPPILRPNDVLVKVHAASVNPIDTALINGYGSQVLNMLRMAGQLEQGIADYNIIEFPITGGRDFVGEVVSVGQNAVGVKIGDRVMGVVSPQRQGSHAQYTVTPASNVCKLPDNISSEEAASIPYAALTGWSAAVVSGMLRPNAAQGKRVLVLGAAGGVGSILCQLLSVWGAQVTGVCSGDAMDLVASIGAEPLDYRDSGTKHMLIADGGYDLVINCSGVDDMEYINALKSWIGASYVTLSPPLLNNIDNSGIVGGLLKSMREITEKNISSVSQGRLYKWGFYMPNTCALKHITKLMAQNRVRGILDKVYGFSETPKAYEYVISGHSRGKTIIKME